MGPRSVLVTAAAALSLSGSAAQLPLRAAGTIALSGVTGRIDHLAIDLDHQRLFVAALGNNTVEAVDVRPPSARHRADGVREPQGLAYLPDRSTIVVATGEGGDVQFRDAADLHLLRAVTLGDDADNVRYDPSAHRVFVGYGQGALAAISEDGRREGEVRLPGHPESFQLETSGTRIFVNVPSARQVAVVRRDTMTLAATWPVTIALGNYPMALDESGHRLFIACRRPAMLVAYDTISGGETGSTDIIGDADDLFWDAKRRRVYVSGGGGAIDVLETDGASFKRIARVPTAAGARTCLFVPAQDRLYLAVPAAGGRTAEIRVFDAQD